MLSAKSSAFAFSKITLFGFARKVRLPQWAQSLHNLFKSWKNQVTPRPPEAHHSLCGLWFPSSWFPWLQSTKMQPRVPNRLRPPVVYLPPMWTQKPFVIQPMARLLTTPPIHHAPIQHRRRGVTSRCDCCNWIDWEFRRPSGPKKEDEYVGNAKSNASRSGRVFKPERTPPPGIHGHLPGEPWLEPPSKGGQKVA